ncbi:MAG TPA: ABC transporter ATP-binding protein [Bacteriovoracaceae bacterium]|nr:ABC transporter ATP-binding protein [Bacteriovoracaceae bacterium]
MDKILVVDGVTKEYPGRVAVSKVSFEVKKGSIHGFLGPNGAGKSTTLRMIAGLLPVTEGKITLFGEEVTPEKMNLKNQIGLLPENAPLYLDMTVEKYLELVAKLHLVKDVKGQVDFVLNELSLTEVRKRLIGNLSKGYRQRVGLAQAIVYNAPFLILDEPTNGLDPQTVVELRDFIKKLSQEKTILFSSHVLPEVEQLCDDITIIHKGKIRASGNLRDIHRKFRQGLVVKVGLSSGQDLPDLSGFGAYEVTHKYSVGTEDQFLVSFEADLDTRAELIKFILSSGKKLLTMQVESPELEDIFLHMTETRS